MLQKRTPARSRRALCVEPLEERVVLNGQVNVFAFPFPGLLGHLIITNDNSPLTANAISINQVTLGGVPNIEVRGFNNTGVNGTTNGVADFPINGGASGPINSIDINNPNFFGSPATVTGNHTVLIGNTAAPTITGNLTIDYGAGHDTVNAKINSNAVVFTGNFGAGTGSDTFTMHDSQNGQINLLAGTGSSSFTISNDTEGQVLTTQLGGGGNTLNITNNKNLPPPRTAALGIVNSIMGTGNNNATISNSIMGTDTLKIGFNSASMPAGQGSNNVNITNDTIVGPTMTVDIENQAGEEGNAPGGPGRGKTTGSVNHTTINGVNFTNNGNFNVTQADGVFYQNGSGALTAASSFSMLLLDGINHLNVNVGDWTRLWNLGNTDTPGSNDVDANTVTATFGQGSQVGKFDAETTGSQQLTVDQAASTDLGFTSGFFGANGNPSLTQTGSAGNSSHSGSSITDFIGNNWPLTIGSHLVGSSNVGAESATGDFLVNNPGFLAAPFFVNPVVPPIPIVGVPGNGDNIKISNAFVGGILQIFEGANTGVASESITVGGTGAPVSANDMDLQVNTNFGDMVTITVTNSLVRDASGNLSFNINDGFSGSDSGLGNDTIYLGGPSGSNDPGMIPGGGGPLQIVSQGSVLAANGGVNTVVAEFVSSLNLTVDGGGFNSSFAGVAANYGNVSVFAQDFGSQA